MFNANRKRSIPAEFWMAVIIVLLECFVPYGVPEVHAASPAVVDLEPITIDPDLLSYGQFPKIETKVSKARKAAGEYVVVNIIAAVTQPDNRVKSWSWQKVRISRGESRTISIPKEYDTSIAGTYRVEVSVYSDDMKRRYARRSRSFTVAERRQMPVQRGKEPQEGKKGAAIGPVGAEPERVHAGLGIYGNVLNPAGGGTLYLWPSGHIGIQGIYSIGEFSTYEGRLLVKTGLSSKYSVYGGIGYIHVTAEKDIIGVTTKFVDGGMSGVIGLEVALGKKVFLYVESSAAKIDLEKTVTNGPQTVKATVDYAPVTIGLSLVMAIF